MIDPSASIYWCGLQVTVVSFVGLSIAWLIRRRQANHASSIACATAGVVALLTILAPLPVHNFFTDSTDGMVEGSESSLTTIADSGHSRGSPRSEATGVANALSIGFSELLNVIRSVGAHAETPRHANSGLVQILAFTCLAALVAGVVRFALNLTFVANLRRQARPINEAQLLQAATRISRQIGCRSVPQLRESDAISSAAVAGLFPPVILLPEHWREWNSEELDTVLAHELVHVHRHDFVWRVLTCGVQSIHFVNPVIHWLLNRVVLYQELAADEIASNVVGQQKYLRALSSLALQRDTLDGHGCPTVVPVFTGHLIRRIKMLRSMDGIHSTPTSPRRRLVLPLALVVSVAVSLIAIRGLSQTVNAADENSELKNPVRTISKTEVTSRDGIPDVSANRASIDLIDFPNNNTGMSILRVHELLEQPALQTLVPTLNTMLAKAIAGPFADPDGPKLDLTSIDWMAAEVKVTLARNVEPLNEEGHRNKIMFATTGTTIRFRDPVNLTDWIARYVPNAEVQHLQEQTVIRMPIIQHLEQMQIGGLWLRQTDDHTVQFAFCGTPDVPATQEKLAEVFCLAGGAERNQPARWERPWRKIEQGLVGLVFTDADVRSGLAIDESDTGSKLHLAARKLTASICNRCTLYGVGIDIDARSSAVTQLRLTHADPSSARQTHVEFKQFLRLIKEESFDSEELSDIQQERLLRKIAAETTVKTEDTVYGTVDLVVESTVDLPSLVTLMVLSR